MKKEKHDPCSTKEKKTRREECTIPDEQRCQRADRKKNWRCKKARVNHIYCQHHKDLAARNYLVRKEKKKCREDKESSAIEDQKDTNQVVGVSKRGMKSVSRIITPEIAEEIAVPSDISDLGELLPTLLIEAWNRELTPMEKLSLRELLPEGHRDDAAVISIFCGGTSRFGIDRAGNWCRSVCEGKESPDAVLERERELKIFQAKYLKTLEEYHEGFLAKAEWFKRLWSDTCNRDDRMFSQLLEKGKFKLNPTLLR
ncbi:hypothetical protein SUGI_0690120 [Cryptomeria japonica]|nr:hypothetical protein SUGI_0690110 [Cryptomeria japonica]GLJ34321.1 hypothetical protein SUGI_0690120 [Cryptomeria japonica]